MDDKIKYVLVFFMSVLVTFVMSYALKPVYLIFKAYMSDANLFWLPDVLLVLGIMGLLILSIFMILGMFNTFMEQGKSRRVRRGYRRRSFLSRLGTLVVKLWPFLILALMILIYFNNDYLMSLVPDKKPDPPQYQYIPEVPVQGVRQDSLLAPRTAVEPKSE